MQRKWHITSQEVFAQGPIIPVLVINELSDSLPIAEALLKGGIKTIEITLRTKNALAIVSTIAKELPEILVGVGTVTNAHSLQQATEAGAQFLISPGLTSDLLNVANAGHVPLIPGISSISELMTGLDHGYDHFKFFPAEQSGGVAKLKAIYGPFADVLFCPTGGIKPDNAANYLCLPNVACVGGSWLVSKENIASKNWQAITQSAESSLAQFR